MDKLAKKKAKDWKQGEEATLVDMLNDNTYNYRAFLENSPEEAYMMLNADPKAHFTDAGKTVYHPTFSNESIYSGKVSDYNPSGTVGGSWSSYGDVYTPDISQIMNGDFNYARTRAYLDQAESNPVDIRFVPAYRGGKTTHKRPKLSDTEYLVRKTFNTGGDIKSSDVRNQYTRKYAQDIQNHLYESGIVPYPIKPATFYTRYSDIQNNDELENEHYNLFGELDLDDGSVEPFVSIDNVYDNDYGYQYTDPYTNRPVNTDNIESRIAHEYWHYADWANGDKLGMQNYSEKYVAPKVIPTESSIYDATYPDIPQLTDTVYRHDLLPSEMYADKFAHQYTGLKNDRYSLMHPDYVQEWGGWQTYKRGKIAAPKFENGKLLKLDNGYTRAAKYDKPLSGADPVGKAFVEYYSGSKAFGTAAKAWDAARSAKARSLYRDLRQYVHPKEARRIIKMPGMTTASDDPGLSFLEELGHLYVTAQKNPVLNAILP